MANVSVSEASRLVGRGRATLHRHIKSGKLSVSRDEMGATVIDTAELVRVYGAMSLSSETVASEIVHDETVAFEALREELRAAREREKAAQEREEWLKKQLEALQERNLALEKLMLPSADEKKSFFKRLFG